MENIVLFLPPDERIYSIARSILQGKGKNIAHRYALEYSINVLVDPHNEENRSILFYYLRSEGFRYEERSLISRYSLEFIRRYSTHFELIKNNNPVTLLNYDYRDKYFLLRISQ